jgi:biopolymer transport protein ExbB
MSLLKGAWTRKWIFSKSAALLLILIVLFGSNAIFAQGDEEDPFRPVTAPVPEASPSGADVNVGEEPETTSNEDATAPEKATVGEIIRSAGLVGLLIVLLSILGVALLIEHLLTIRASVLIPPELGEEVHDMLSNGEYRPALDRCREDPSLLGQVLEAGVLELDGDWPAVEKAVEDAMTEQSARLLRKIEYLSVIGNIAPMLGLLGTVLGMVVAFRELSVSQGSSQAADLANGIYQALLTTVLGLIVAIPSLAAFAVFRNRVDYFMAEVAYMAQHVFGPVKRKYIRASGSHTGNDPLGHDSPMPPPSSSSRRGRPPEPPPTARE